MWDFRYGPRLGDGQLEKEPVEIPLQSNLLAHAIEERFLFLGTNKGDLFAVDRHNTARSTVCTEPSGRITFPGYRMVSSFALFSSYLTGVFFLGVGVMLFIYEGCVSGMVVVNLQLAYLTPSA